MKLELKHIAPYLPYGVKWKRNNYDAIYEVTGIDVLMPSILLEFKSSSDIEYAEDEVKNGKPILRHLSSMTKKEAYDLLCLIIGIEDIGFKQSDLDYISLNYGYDVLEIEGKFPFDDYVCGTRYTINISNDGIACFDTESNGAYISHSAYGYLLSKHFDIFGLIDEGVAIDKTTFK